MFQNELLVYLRLPSLNCPRLYLKTGTQELGHENIIKYTGRPFKSLEHMNRMLIHNHNSRVKEKDTVFFLGDFCFKNTPGGKSGEGVPLGAEHYLEKLNGRFIFIKGNHDNNNSLKTIIEGIVIQRGGKYIYLVHRPEDIEPEIKINFVGHIHEKWRFKKVGKNDLINVGTDVWNFMPVTFEEIMKEYERWKNE